MLWVSAWLVVLLYLFNNRLILVIASPNKGWTYHKSTINIVLPILEISFCCWAAPPGFAELFSRSQARRSTGSRLCHQWQYLTIRKVMPDVTPTLQPISCVPLCAGNNASVSGSLHASALPLKALLRAQIRASCSVRLAKMERHWWWVWWQFCGILYELFLSCCVLQRQKHDPSPLFPAAKQGWQLTKSQRMGKWDAVQSKVLVNMPKIQVSIGRISYALHNLQFVTHFFLHATDDPVLHKSCINKWKKMFHERHVNNSSSCLRKSIIITVNSSLQVQQVYRRTWGRIFTPEL